MQNITHRIQPTVNIVISLSSSELLTWSCFKNKTFSKRKDFEASPKRLDFWLYQNYVGYWPIFGHIIIGKFHCDMAQIVKKNYLIATVLDMNKGPWSFGCITMHWAMPNSWSKMKCHREPCTLVIKNLVQ